MNKSKTKMTVMVRAMMHGLMVLLPMTGVAAVQHPRSLAGRVVALPQHFWCPRFYPHQLYGSLFRPGFP